MLIGGGIAVFIKAGGNFRSLILHFAAGVVISVAGIEILPDIMDQHSPYMMSLGFVFGAAIMIGTKKLTSKNESNQQVKNKIPWTLITAIGIDLFIDGLLLGVGFAAGNKEGILLSIALSFELLSVGIALATEMHEMDSGRKKIFTAHNSPFNDVSFQYDFKQSFISKSIP